jgi:hypothetical protein
LVCNLPLTQLDEIRKTSSIFLKMEDDLNFFENGRRPQFLEMEDNLNFLEMEYNLNFLGKWKTTLIFLNGRRPHYFVNKIIKQPKTFKIETMVVAPLRVTLFCN